MPKAMQNCVIIIITLILIVVMRLALKTIKSLLVLSMPTQCIRCTTTTRKRVHKNEHCARFTFIFLDDFTLVFLIVCAAHSGKWGFSVFDFALIFLCLKLQEKSVNVCMGKKSFPLLWCVLANRS